jgi:hypothetical protein
MKSFQISQAYLYYDVPLESVTVIEGNLDPSSIFEIMHKALIRTGEIGAQ